MCLNAPVLIIFRNTVQDISPSTSNPNSNNAPNESNASVTRAGTPVSKSHMATQPSTSINENDLKSGAKSRNKSAIDEIDLFGSLVSLHEDNN